MDSVSYSRADMWDLEAPAQLPPAGEGRSRRSQRAKQAPSDADAGGSVLSEEHLFSVFNELGVPLGLDGDLPPGCGGALGGAKPPAPYPARAARPAASWDEPGGGGASASDAQASSEPDLDDEDDSGEDSGPARGRVGTRGRARAAGRGRGRGRPDGRARGRGQVRPRPRELEDADEWTDGEDEEADVGGGRGRVKRVMANRQSAQRSRMRKLQFISDLEAEVNRLQADLEQLAPAVAALRTKHAGLVAAHDELCTCAANLLQKCRQAEKVNAGLRGECVRLRAQQQARPPRPPAARQGRLVHKGCAHLPVAMDEDAPGVGTGALAQPPAFLMAAAMGQGGAQLQVHARAGPPPDPPLLWRRPSSAPQPAPVHAHAAAALHT